MKSIDRPEGDGRGPKQGKDDDHGPASQRRALKVPNEIAPERDQIHEVVCPALRADEQEAADHCQGGREQFIGIAGQPIEITQYPGRASRNRTSSAARTAVVAEVGIGPRP